MIFMEDNNLLLEKNIKFIVVHCSDTDDNLKALDIHKLHLNFGWEGVGYHKIIEKDGRIVNGRPEFWKGAHVRGYNDKSLGVCLIGKSRFSKAQFISLKKILIDWKKKYKNTKIIGHYEVSDSSKTCPNFDVAQWCHEQGLND